MADVVQLVEHLIVAQVVAGSSPVIRPQKVVLNKATFFI